MLVRNVTHILNNIDTFEGYRKSKNPDEKKFFVDRLRKGKNFIAIKINSRYNFAPSRFAGYLDNNVSKHNDNPYKDGRDTDDRIIEIMKSQPKQDSAVEKAFLEICKELKIEPENRERKYWVIELPNLKWFE